MGFVYFDRVAPLKTCRLAKSNAQFYFCVVKRYLRLFVSAMFQALAEVAPRHSIQITSKETQSETVLVILRLQKTVNALTGSLRWSSRQWCS